MLDVQAWRNDLDIPTIVVKASKTGKTRLPDGHALSCDIRGSVRSRAGMLVWGGNCWLLLRQDHAGMETSGNVCDAPSEEKICVN